MGAVSKKLMGKRKRRMKRSIKTRRRDRSLIKRAAVGGSERVGLERVKREKISFRMTRVLAIAYLNPKSRNMNQSSRDPRSTRLEPWKASIKNEMRTDANGMKPMKRGQKAAQRKKNTLVLAISRTIEWIGWLSDTWGKQNNLRNTLGVVLVVLSLSFQYPYNRGETKYQHTMQTRTPQPQIAEINEQKKLPTNSQKECSLKRPLRNKNVEWQTNQRMPKLESSHSQNNPKITPTTKRQNQSAKLSSCRTLE